MAGGKSGIAEAMWSRGLFSFVLGEPAATYVHPDSKAGFDLAIDESGVVRLYVPGTDYVGTLRCLCGAGKVLASLHVKEANELDKDFVRLFACCAAEEMMQRVFVRDGP